MSTEKEAFWTNFEEKAFWTDYVLFQIPAMCSATIVLSLCMGAMTIPLYSKPPDQLNWLENQFIHTNLKSLVLKKDWYEYYKERALFGFRTGCSVSVTLALLNASVIHANRRNKPKDVGGNP